MSDILLSELHFYPVKSLRGVKLQRAPVDRRGIRRDRHWMVVDESGRFLTQRQESRMALIGTRLIPGGLRLCAPGMADLELPFEEGSGEPLQVQVWEDLCQARAAGPAADQWLGRFLGRPCRLVYLPEESRRPVDPAFATPQDQTGFSDGFPFLLISQASLDDLNARLSRPVPMRRFRPNLVVQGCAPYAEDRWRRIRIGAVEFRVVKPCSRCAIPTIDIDTGERGQEPLRTLGQYRRRDNKVYFGQNLLHDGTGVLETGLRVEVLEQE